jgi:hypothetical protein
MISVGRMALFLVGCIGSRLVLVWLAWWIGAKQPAWLGTAGWIALIPAIGFTLIWFLGLRRTGGEVLGGRIWWNDLRPFHALFWGAFAVAAIGGLPWAWQILLADVIFGIGAWVHHRLVLGA